MSSSVHIDNKNKDILILGEGRTQGLDDTTLTAEAKYSINFTQPRNILVLSLHIMEVTDFNTSDTNDILDIRKHLVKKII